jgi:hypothetical protein
LVQLLCKNLSRSDFSESWMTEGQWNDSFQRVADFKKSYLMNGWQWEEVIYMDFHLEETDIVMVPLDFNKTWQVRSHGGMSHLVGTLTPARDVDFFRLYQVVESNSKLHWYLTVLVYRSSFTVQARSSVSLQTGEKPTWYN